VVCRLPTEPVVSSGGWNRTSGLHVQSVALLPTVTAPESSYYVDLIREGGLEPPSPDSKSGSLPVSRFPSRESKFRAPRGSRTRLSGLGSPCLAARPETLLLIDRFLIDQSISKAGSGNRTPVAWLEARSRAARPIPRRFCTSRAEGEGVEPSRLIARLISNQVPSPFGLPFRIPDRRLASARTAHHTKHRRKESNLQSSP
jgi:hypothetical protein